MLVIDHWDWIRIALGLALIGCNIGVWRGVALEESHDRFDKEIGKTLLIRSLALEALFAAALFVVDTIAGVGQKIEIAQLEASNLQLEAQIQPRRLMPEQQTLIATSLGKYGGRRLRLGSYALDEEAKILAVQINEIFLKADIRVVDQQISAMGAVANFAVGINVTGSDKELVDAIADSLRLIGKLKDVGTAPIPPPPPPPPNAPQILTTGPELPEIPVDAKVLVGVKPITP